MKRIFFGLCISAAGLHADDSVAFFESKVRPLLIESCYECHDAKKQKGGPRLDSLPGRQAGGYTAIAAAISASPTFTVTS